MRRSLTKRERLGRGPDLDRLFSSGRRTGCPGCKLVTLANGLTWSRVAVVNARGYRRAVDRNRDRRLFRESYRLIKHTVPVGLDLAVVLYPGPYTSCTRRAQFREVMRKSGMLRPRKTNG